MIKKFEAKKLILIVVLLHLSGCGGSSSPSSAKSITPVGSGSEPAPDVVETPVDGPSKISLTPGFYANNNISIQGTPRTYSFYIPQNITASSIPLVLLLHGYGGSSDEISGEDGSNAPYKVWMSLADRDKFIVLYPEGTQGENELGWNDCRADAQSNPTADDVSFLGALIDLFSISQGIDSRRVYVSGTSNGGHMALRLALELSNKVSAVAPIAAAMPENSQCVGPVSAIPILFVNGTNDPILPYNGGLIGNAADQRGSALSTSASIELWVNFNQANPSPTIDDLPNINDEDESTITRSTYFGTRNTALVGLIEVLGGGHTEPSIQEQYSTSIERILGKQNHDIEIAEEIWAWLRLTN